MSIDLLCAVCHAVLIWSFFTLLTSLCYQLNPRHFTDEDMKARREESLAQAPRGELGLESKLGVSMLSPRHGLASGLEPPLHSRLIIKLLTPCLHLHVSQASGASCIQTP